MVELVDTTDLKSVGHCDRAGSSPAPGTKSSSTDGDFLIIKEHHIRKKVILANPGPESIRPPRLAGVTFGLKEFRVHLLVPSM